MKANPVHRDATFWQQPVQEWYPELHHDRTYFLPPVFLRRTQHTEEQLSSGHPGLVTQPPQFYRPIDGASPLPESDVLDKLSQQMVLDPLRRMCSTMGEDMCVLSQLECGHCLNEPCFDATPSARPSLPIDQKTGCGQKGDFDILIIHRRHGILVCESKAIGNHLFLHPQQQLDQQVKKKVEQAIRQLNKAKSVLQHFLSDLQPQPRVQTTLMLPNIARWHLQRVLVNDKQLLQSLRRCVGVPVHVDPTPLCLTSEDVYNPNRWWQQRVTGAGTDPAMTEPIYVNLVTRLRSLREGKQSRCWCFGKRDNRQCLRHTIIDRMTPQQFAENLLNFGICSWSVNGIIRRSSDIDSTWKFLFAVCTRQGVSEHAEFVRSLRSALTYVGIDIASDFTEILANGFPCTCGPSRHQPAKELQARGLHSGPETFLGGSASCLDCRSYPRRQLLNREHGANLAPPCFAGEVSDDEHRVNCATRGNEELKDGRSQFLMGIYSELLEDVEPIDSGLLDMLRIDGIMSSQEEQFIKMETTRKEKANKIVMLLQRIHPNPFQNCYYPILRALYPRALQRKQSQFQCGEKRGDEHCLRHDIMNRMQTAITFADHLVEWGLCSWQEHRNIHQSVIWDDAFNVCTRSAVKSNPIFVESLKQKLRTKGVLVPVNFKDILGNGFPCVASPFLESDDKGQTFKTDKQIPVTTKLTKSSSSAQHKLKKSSLSTPDKLTKSSSSCASDESHLRPEQTDVQESMKYWRVIVNKWYPRVLSRSYFPLSLHLTKKEKCDSKDLDTLDHDGSVDGNETPSMATAESELKLLVSKYPSPVLPSSWQDSDLRDEVTQQEVLRCLQRIPNEVMFVISQFNYRAYLNEPAYAKAVARLSRPVDLKHLNKHRGDFDILIIHRQYGVLVGEVKSIGNNFDAISMPEQQQEAMVAKRIQQSLKQLDKACEVLSHLMSDLDTRLRVLKTVMLPCISKRQLQRVLDASPQLRMDLCECLKLHADEDPCGLCLTSDDVTDPTEWWQHRMIQSDRDIVMTDELYLDLVSRFAGPATTAEPCYQPVLTIDPERAVQPAEMDYDTVELT